MVAVRCGVLFRLAAADYRSAPGDRDGHRCELRDRCDPTGDAGAGRQPGDGVLRVHVLPVTFPVERLPDWYARVHKLLPVMPAGDVIRAGLVTDTYSVGGQALLVLAAWTVAGIGLTLLALTRRKSDETRKLATLCS